MYIKLCFFFKHSNKTSKKKHTVKSKKMENSQKKPQKIIVRAKGKQERKSMLEEEIRKTKKKERTNERTKERKEERKKEEEKVEESKEGRRVE